MTKTHLRQLRLSDAQRCAELVLEHYMDDPGYRFVWGCEPDVDALKQMYTAKMQRLIRDNHVRTWGASVDKDSESVIAFVAWNPPNYRKSLSLSMQQRWATSSIWRIWPLSALFPTTRVLTPLQERHRQLTSFRRPLEQSLVEELGPNHIWTLHFAGAMEAVDAIMLDKVIKEAETSGGCAVRLSSQHSQDSVEHACAKWGCRIASRSSFTGDNEGSEPFDTVFLVRPAAA